MAHKQLGGWIIKNKVFAQIKVAGELWSFARKDDSGEKQTHLIFVGWYDKNNKNKLFSITILWVSIQFGLSV